MKLMIPSRKTHQIHQTPNSGQQTKFSLTNYAFMYYINHRFIHFLFMLFMRNVSIQQGYIVLRNISAVTEGVHGVQMYCPWEKSRPFQKKYKKETFDLVLPHFNFWLATEMLLRNQTTAISRLNKDKICSIMILQQFGFVVFIFRSSHRNCS